MAETGTVLVVDNDSDQLGMMKEIIDRLGYHATTTDDPQEAVELVKKQDFNLILIDLIMPEIDGLELCEQIKQVRPSACVYAISGHVHLYRPERLVRAGFDETINKPATMDEIKQVLSRAVGPQPAP